jgi:hypothetical protein
MHVLAALRASVERCSADGLTAVREHRPWRPRTRQQRPQKFRLPRACGTKRDGLERYSLCLSPRLSALERELLWLELPDWGVERYRVSWSYVVDQAHTSALETPGQWLTLATCYPFDAATPGGPLHYVVQAARA